MHKDLEYYLVGLVFLILAAVGKTLDKLRKKEISDRLGIVSSLIASLVGGLVAAAIASVWIETVQIQWVIIAAGSWMGERTLEVVGASLEEKINIMFNVKKESKDEK